MKKLTLSLAAFIFTAFSSNLLLAQFNMEVKTSSTKTVNGRVVSSESSHSTISSDNGFKVKESSSSYKDGKFKSETNEYGIGGNNQKNSSTNSSFIETDSKKLLEEMNFGNPQKSNQVDMNTSSKSQLDEFMKPRSAEEIARINQSQAELKLANAEAKKAKAEAKLIKQQTKMLKEQNKIAEKDRKAAEKAEADRKRKEEGAWITQQVKSADSFFKDRKAKKQAKQGAQEIQQTNNNTEISE